MEGGERVREGEEEERSHLRPRLDSGVRIIPFSTGSALRLQGRRDKGENRSTRAHTHTHRGHSLRVCPRCSVGDRIGVNVAVNIHFR